MLLIWDTKHIPQEWLHSRISLIYKIEPPVDAKNYGPIAVSTSLSAILACLILSRIKHPPNAALSGHQAGNKQGRTTSDQAASLYVTLCNKDKVYVYLLNITKAYPSPPHLAVSTALEAIGTPHKLIHLVNLIHQ